MGKRRRNHKGYKSKKNQENLFFDMYSDMDDTFSYIAGYTPGGAPYGVTWEEVGIDSNLPFEEKVSLYMKQADVHVEELTVDVSDELPLISRIVYMEDIRNEESIRSNPGSIPDAGSDDSSI